MSYNFHPSPYSRQRIIEGLSITAAGRIGLSPHFLATHHIERGVRANLYWDAKHRLLAIEFTSSTDVTAHPVSFTRRYGGFINAARFFRHQQINPGEYVGRYSYTVAIGSDVGITTNTNVLLIDLSKQPTRRQRPTHG